jgi:predicted lipoprotein with Yx(FWY)xxD motif
MSDLLIGKLGRGAAGVTAVVMLVAGCASSSGGGSSAKAPAGGSANGLKTTKTSIGTVLVNASGHTVYELVGDTAAKPTCTGSCLKFWPPVNANGHQVIVHGHPAYTYLRDTSAGDTKGQNLKDKWGVWLALDANGNPIKSGAPKSKAPSGGGPAF